MSAFALTFLSRLSLEMALTTASFVVTGESIGPPGSHPDQHVGREVETLGEIGEHLRGRQRGRHFLPFSNWLTQESDTSAARARDRTETLGNFSLRLDEPAEVRKRLDRRMG